MPIERNGEMKKLMMLAVAIAAAIPATMKMPAAGSWEVVVNK